MVLLPHSILSLYCEEDKSKSCFPQNNEAILKKYDKEKNILALEDYI